MIIADIAGLHLTPRAAALATALRVAFPWVAFTSGRRDLDGQARAMAANVMRRRNWIISTYIPSQIRAELQRWVDEHENVDNENAIAAGLLVVLSAFPHDELSRRFRHLDGEAFDILPTTSSLEPPKDSDAGRLFVWFAGGHALAALIAAGFSGSVKLLKREGGLPRWHAEIA